MLSITLDSQESAAHDMAVLRRRAAQSNTGHWTAYICSSAGLSNKRTITIGRTQRSAAVIQDVNNMLSNSPPTDHATGRQPVHKGRRGRRAAVSAGSATDLGRQASSGRALSRRSATRYLYVNGSPCFANKLQPANGVGDTAGEGC